MEITLENVGRRFNREWIFKHINYTFSSGKSYAILGINGSGKSTLLQILSGSLSPSQGKITFQNGSKHIEIDNVFQKVSIAAPYLELIEDFTLSEAIDFHFRFKTSLNNITAKEVIALLGMEKSKNKQIKYFSSGMKQRVKLALAFLSDTELLFLDEPCSNLDSQGIDWYLELVRSYAKDRLTIVCSNQEVEYSFCENQLRIIDYK
ncbi:ABC transporter related protein [Pseudopedobacter saltans DSM 12145]|uniref:ABC transporter related protein n=1 Tax=Pseudopedobacter saltans (strain ATCC 51119 / DSM 12145 / JCM 21818 / CCUG 39354 / LMG 10337 / NBRC 100064 / NCIMB 13643) TaxID=762903 RepID=F0S8F3_PSESL|nr:ABC transporter ATP-binding protein [Pseudopedobacter saltans]ADY53417.1 ABC transporter related protein [Pseudopedobacter saltans DSM 12145]